MCIICTFLYNDCTNSVWRHAGAFVAKLRWLLESLLYQNITLAYCNSNRASGDSVPRSTARLRGISRLEGPMQEEHTAEHNVGSATS